MAKPKTHVLSPADEEWLEGIGGKQWCRKTPGRLLQRKRYFRLLGGVAAKLGEIGIHDPLDPETLRTIMAVVLSKDGTFGAEFRDRHPDILKTDEGWQRLWSVCAGKLVEEYLAQSLARPEITPALLLDSEMRNSVCQLLEFAVAQGELRPAAEALAEAGIEPVALAEKEGLAMINGTDGMLGMLVLAITDLARLLDIADLTAAMSVEALLGTDRVFAADLQALRPHPGQARSAARMSQILAGSEIMESHRGPDCTRVQDAYSLRCSPQVHGAARDTLAHAEMVADRELDSAIDNPAVLADGRVESNGNFHGAPVAYVLDFLAIPVADVASMAERRTDRMLDVARSHGLPPFLADDPGVDSGHMIAHYTQAAIVSELKRLAVPASVDSIPSSAMQEDHVSMGWSAARKLRKAVDGLTTVLSIELLTAARALDLRAPLKPAPATAAVVALLREHVQGPGPDRHLAPEIAATEALVRSGLIARTVEENS